MKQTEQTCFCGKPLHYSSKESYDQVQKLVDKLGENVKVIVGQKIYLVPRHYIALHGITGKNIAELGFKEFVEVNNGVKR